MRSGQGRVVHPNRFAGSLQFGKTKAEGGGFRSLIAKALELSVPVLIGVPQINLSPFREFSAGLAQEIELSQLVSDPLAAAEPLRSSNWPRCETVAVVERIRVWHNFAPGGTSTDSLEEGVLIPSTVLGCRPKFA
ncbi:DUF2478 domain-containing protein [Mesorhizobium sp. PAMC28654]|uniref:DUF2478 domain-containing protein n=1 Tax=Mesorhizobium sp. PAMC28654 TaxID=2880934 RepID=UPI001D0AE5E0|nr:DUF2478 domain-containing protein [Mesorhizobium sp. PAMC28654]UDL90756.1 DUF2478 domain-containing protein [Mesorhizobium sp. PAMC28654]